MKNIVIAGFGDTGVLVAAHLKKIYDITAITTKPAVVSGQELGARLTNLPLWREKYLLPFDRVKELDPVTIIHGKATAIDTKNNALFIQTAEGQTGKLNYDALVLATGTQNGFWRDADITGSYEIDAALDSNARTLTHARTLAIVGAGPTGVSTASNAKAQFPEKDVHLFFRQDEILSGYPPKTRAFVTERLSTQGVHLHSGHHADLPDHFPALQPGTITFQSGQERFDADCVLWAAGRVKPNSEFIPADILDAQGFVRVNKTLQAEGLPNVFAIGDIAATDPHRSSARNEGYKLLAANIHKYLSAKPEKMKPFRPPTYRWGSILGIQDEGLRIFTPKGGNVRVGRNTVDKILFPVFVHRMIYRGIRN